MSVTELPSQHTRRPSPKRKRSDTDGEILESRERSSFPLAKNGYHTHGDTFELDEHNGEDDGYAYEDESDLEPDASGTQTPEESIPVSYTHLTLPTIYSV